MPLIVEIEDMPGGISGEVPAQLSNANIDDTGWMMNERVKYTANTATASISTANANLDGTGTIADLITGASYGTLVKRIIVKATGNTTRGFVRVFYKAGLGATSMLLWEIPVPAVTRGTMDHSFVAELRTPFYLKASYLLRVSTQNAENFIVMAEGLDMDYPA
jgi:hypothetical protein